MGSSTAVCRPERVSHPLTRCSPPAGYEDGQQKENTDGGGEEERQEEDDCEEKEGDEDEEDEEEAEEDEELPCRIHNLGGEVPRLWSRPGTRQTDGVQNQNGRRAPRTEGKFGPSCSKKGGKEAIFSKKRGEEMAIRRPQRDNIMSSSCLWCQHQGAPGWTNDDDNNGGGRTLLPTSPRTRATHHPHGAHNTYSSYDAYTVYSAYNIHSIFIDALDTHGNHDEHEECDEQGNFGEPDESQELSAGFQEKPDAFFCSWECASRWNMRFSPVQARHERGLRIDVAAGRLVA